MLRHGLRGFQSSVRPIRHHGQLRAYQQRRFGDPRPQYRRFNAAGLFMRWAARPTFYRDVGLISVGAGSFYLYNLEEVPVSGRRRFNIISPSLEEYIGKSTVEQVKEEYRGRFLPEYDPRVKQVKRVLARLLPLAQRLGLQDMQWEVHVIDGPEQNAFVAPGGKVFVFTGILPLCRNEDGIAAVLGHEIAHVVAHHTAERMSQSPLILIGMALLLSFDFSFGLSKLLLDAFLAWPASRKQEAEADHIGLLMMAEGCYRPEAAMEFWNRMEKLGQQGPPQILSTHPSHQNREAQIREWLPQAHQKAADSDCHAMSDYANQFSAAFGSPRW
ncbi:mitochondrial metalloendopeptidase OMA1 [Lentithecium fluviatile CBS 122367]|uniref:Mitochondrial metalloendopeptidase OMA1 n=1 Tax=Lentithecium fluviatile CBS 122367 TaxID=1168545 RepID=A0A6G1IID2_9PLEO|nr:mitochondrial metalloendopeptidase OMA1 [Lentithecium fluviatile CBS 122367]